MFVEKQFYEKNETRHKLRKGKHYTLANFK